MPRVSFALLLVLAACGPAAVEDPCGAGPAHLQNTRYAEAETAFEACLAGRGHDWESEAELRMGLAAAQMAQERPEAALETYAQILALMEAHTGDSGHPVVRRNRAMALLRLGRPEAALDDVEIALARSPRDPLARMIAGAAHLETGEAAAAAAAFDAVLALAPDDIGALSGRSAAFAELGRHDESLADALEAVSIAPEDASALNALCWSLVKAGRAGDALPTCDAALEARPDSGPITHSRAAALEQLGRIDEARDLYARAHALEPASREIAADYNRTRQP
ncbi:MAG: tetratricopeptide repeat protein [Oceanicaulis sp.]|nr:tetratricopeptide repeat protein [Oceanicaulis sp.]